MKKLLLVILLLSNQTYAESLWARDCVTWYGGKIPVAERTKENCPSGYSHLDSIEERYPHLAESSDIPNTGNTGPSYNQSPGTGTTSNTTVGITTRTYNLPTASYMVIRSGSTTTVIQTSKSK